MASAIRDGEADGHQVQEGGFGNLDRFTPEVIADRENEFVCAGGHRRVAQQRPGGSSVGVGNRCGEKLSRVVAGDPPKFDDDPLCRFAPRGVEHVGRQPPHQPARRIVKVNRP